jgi:hypothetical protein
VKSLKLLRGLAARGVVPVLATLLLSAQATAGALPTGKWWGITFDDVSNLTAEVDAVSAMPQKPFVRIVFDNGTKPGDYSAAVSQLGSHAYLMGEILDSTDLPRFSTSAYASRVTTWLNAFGSQINLWETCNECNGVTWVGSGSAAKAIDAIKQVKSRGLAAAITLYLCPDSVPEEQDPVAWALKNIPSDVRSQVDAALISYYPGDCGGSPDWTSLFVNLADAFPNAKVGLGEIGTANPSSNAQAQAILTKYMTLDVPVSSYITGGFWWYAAETMVPRSQPLWSTFVNLMSPGYVPPPTSTPPKRCQKKKRSC